MPRGQCGKVHDRCDVVTRTITPSQTTSNRAPEIFTDGIVIPAVNKAPARVENIEERFPIDRDLEHSSIIARLEVVIMLKRHLRDGGRNDHGGGIQELIADC